MRIRTRFVLLVSAAVLLSLGSAFAAEADRAGMQEILSAPLSPAERDLKLLGWFEQQYAQGAALSEADKEMYLQLESRHADLREREALDNQGGPDAFQYTFVDNVAPDATPYEWIELRGDPSATWLRGLTHFTGIDDGYSRQKLPIGFSFPFYGAVYDCVRVMCNGLLNFTTTTQSLTNVCLPASSVNAPMIAVFWDDLHLLRGRADTVVVGYRNFVDYFVIEFDQIGFYSSSCTTGVSLKFQAVLYPNGNIKLQYNNVPIPTACANSQSIGIQQAGTAGSAALNYVCNTTGIQPANGRAILFSRAGGVPNPVTNLAGNYVAPNVVLTWTDPTQDTQGNPITITNVQVWLGAVSTGTLLATVSPGVQTYTHTTPPAGSITYSVRAYRNPYYGGAATVTVQGALPTYPNGFETDNGGWVADPPTGGWEWGAPTYTSGPAAHGGSKVWGTVLAGTYAVSACYKLTLARNQLVTSPDASVTFWGWYSIEGDLTTAWDGCNFKVSVDSGTTWQQVQPTPAYDDASTSTDNVCIPLEPSWNGTTVGNTWRQMTIPIGQFLGQTPMFRFSLGSDASLNYAGFYFDDMNITGLGGTGAVPRPPTNLAGNYAGGNVTLTWTDPTLDIFNQPMTADSLQIWLGTTSTGTRLGSVNPGVQTYVHVNAPTGVQTYSVRAYNDGFPGAAATTTVIVGTPSYVNDFDVDNGGWAPDPPTGGWQWGAPTFATGPQPHSAPNCWGTVLAGNYIDGACWKLDLDLGGVVQSPTATVEFWCWYSTENTYDGVNFKVSVNDGQTWTVVAPVGGYPLAQLSATWNRCGTGGQPAWAGAGTTWQRVVIPIGQFVGQTPIFRFDFTSDSLEGVYPGYYFDDMVIWGLQAPSSVAGTVRSFMPSQPIRAAQVWAEGVPDTAITDASGAYELPLDPGTYTLHFRHIHFCDTVHTGVVVVAGSQTVRDAVMRAPHGEVSVTSIGLETVVGVNVADSFTISNTGGQCPLSFTISDTSAWLSVDAVSGTVLPNQTTTIHVQATVTGMAQGDYVSALLVSYNSTGSPADIRVDLYVGPSAVDLSLPLPTEFAYYQNYPNPFNAQTALRFDVPQQSRVQIAIFNIMGQEVARPVDAVHAPGRYRLLYDASDLPSGMYLVKMTAADYTKIGKMMLLK